MRLDPLSSQDCLFVKSVAKSYGRKQAVVDVSLKVSRGEVVGLLGPNGAGKTTVFYIICGLTPCDSGRIYLNEYAITNMPIHIRARMGISYLAQETSIFRGLTVEENVRVALEMCGVKNRFRKERTRELLESLSIDHLHNIQSTALSGGEKRRLEIARALANNPSFMLLDEPFAGVDPVSVHEIIELINSLKAQNVGVLITDHSVRETLKLVDRVYVISAGEVLAQGQPEDILNNDNVRKVYLGEDFNL